MTLFGSLRQRDMRLHAGTKNQRKNHHFFQGKHLCNRLFRLRIEVKRHAGRDRLDGREALSALIA